MGKHLDKCNVHVDNISFNLPVIYLGNDAQLKRYSLEAIILINMLCCLNTREIADHCTR